MDYNEFLASKKMVDPPTGIEDFGDLPSIMFPHQRDIVAWALRRGRAAIFAGTGLGKSVMELAWGEKVAEYTGKPVLHMAPLAVAPQMVREADKFGFTATHVHDQSQVIQGINVTNYQKLDHFDLSKFGGVILDESSILKNQSGHYRIRLIQECQQIPFRLAATATPAPNDYMELGNHSEFLGVMSYTDMLACFFTHDGGDTQSWVLKPHAQNAFWKWMASWSVMLRKPSDLGYPDEGYNLPPLHYHMHEVDTAPDAREGDMFATIEVARSLQDQQKVKRETIAERVAKAASITPPDRQFLWWCHQNAESEALTKAISGAVETKGSDSEDVKEQKLLDFISGKTRVLVSKSQVAGYGLNLQFCADTGFVGMNNSFEQFYQSVRRFWRFGQTKPVNVHIIAATAEGASIANIKRKEKDADRMAEAMVAHTKDISSQAIRGMVRDTASYDPTTKMEVPAWI